MVAVLAATTKYLQVDVELLARIGGLVVPILVAIIAKYVASPKLKSALNVILSAVAGIVALAVAQNGAIDVGHALGAMFDALTISFASYYGFWKPTGVAEKVAYATADFGLGSGGQSNDIDGVGSDESLERIAPPS